MGNGEGIFRDYNDASAVIWCWWTNRDLAELGEAQ